MYPMNDYREYELSIAHEQTRNDKTSFQPHYHLDKTTSELHYHSADWKCEGFDHELAP